MTQDLAPKVSVLMAAYNAMPFLPAAVESILHQSLADFEFVIVDDGSTDGSPAYLQGLTDPRVVLIRQENAGLAAALNTGLSACRAPYVARMDADDVSLPDRLAVQLAFLESHPAIGCVGCQTAPFGEARVGGELKLPTEHAAIVRALAEGRHGLVHPSVMLRTAALREIGGYWPMRVVAEDYDMFLRMSEVTKFATIDRLLYHMRFHMASLNGSGMKRMRRAVDYACDRHARRQAGLSEVSFDQFVAARERAPWWRRVAESIDAHARAQYRAAVADQCAGRPWAGRARLAWAAALAPELTFRRIVRMATARRTAPAPIQTGAPSMEMAR